MAVDKRKSKAIILIGVVTLCIAFVRLAKAETILKSASSVTVTATAAGDIPAPPSTPTLYDPGTTIVNGDFTVDWSDSTSTAGLSVYEFEEATTSKVNDRGYFVNRVGDIKYIPVSQYSFVDHPQGTYYFHVRAQDVNNIKSNWSNVQNLTLSFATISNIQVSNVTATSATITWTTNKASNSRVEPWGLIKLYDTLVPINVRVQGVCYAPVETHGSDVTAAEIDKDLTKIAANNVNAVSLFNLGESALKRADTTYANLEERIFAKCAQLGLKFVVRLEAIDKGRGHWVNGTWVWDEIYFNYGYEDADWVINFYNQTIQLAQKYPNNILYYMINIPLDDIDIPKPTLQKQRDYITYLYNRLKIIAPNQLVFVNFHYGTMDELDQASCADIVDGLSIVQYAVRFTAAPYGINYDVNNNGKPDKGEGPVSTDPNYKIIDKDQFDYFVDKLYTKNNMVAYGGSKKVYIDQSGFAEILNHWSGICADRTTKRKAMTILKEYVEGNPQLNGWFYFILYDKGSEGAYGMLDTKIQGNTSESVTSHRVVLTDLYPSTNYEIYARSGGAKKQGPSFTTLAVSPPANKAPTITITTPGYDGISIRSGENLVIKWRDEDPDNNAWVDLYFDTDDRGHDGILIVGGLKEDDETDSYTWNTYGRLMPGKTYYIYALIRDFVNPSEYDYSNGKVFVLP